MKKIMSFILVICLTVSLFANTISADDTFLTLEETVTIDKEVEKNKDIVFNLNLSLIEYDEFRLYISSNVSLDTLNSDDVNVLDSDIEGEKYFDYNINANILNTNQILLNYKLPNDVNIGDKITFYLTLVDKNDLSKFIELTKTVVVTNKINKQNLEVEKPNEMENPKEQMNIDTKKISTNSIVSNNLNINNTISKQKVVTYPGSDNNYLKSLSVSGYSFNRKFSIDGLTYFVTVGNSVKSLNINAVSISNSASINISGNGNFKAGLNKVLISVTSESGLTRNYRIYVIKEE